MPQVDDDSDLAALEEALKEAPRGAIAVAGTAVILPKPTWAPASIRTAR